MSEVEVERLPAGSRSRVATDGAVAVVVTVLAVALTAWISGPRHGDDRFDAVGVVLLVVAGLALGLRRVLPSVVFLVVAVATGAYLALGYVYGPVIGIFMAALLSAALRVTPRRTVLLSVAGLALTLAHLLVSSRGLGATAIVPVSAWVVVPESLGVALRVHNEADRRARAESLRQRADEERLRVAQEVHDVVGHGLAAIKMQADVALHVSERRPEQSLRALEVISRTSSEALDELRVALSSVRGTGTRQPSLTDLDDLVDRMTRAGLAMTVRTSGGRPEVPSPAVEFVAYRIVQECLTNALRHGAGQRADVEVQWSPAALGITVANPATRREPTVEGHGLRGMRERAASVRGSVAVSHVPGEEFRVCASLPLEHAP